MTVMSDSVLTECCNSLESACQMVVEYKKVRFRLLPSA
jgi:hypothetical protein